MVHLVLNHFEIRTRKGLAIFEWNTRNFYKLRCNQSMMKIDYEWICAHWQISYIAISWKNFFDASNIDCKRHIRSSIHFRCFLFHSRAMQGTSEEVNRSLCETVALSSCFLQCPIFIHHTHVSTLFKRGVMKNASIDNPHCFTSTKHPLS